MVEKEGDCVWDEIEIAVESVDEQAPDYFMR